MSYDKCARICVFDASPDTVKLAYMARLDTFALAM
jgi:hypothetical protein